MKFKLPGYGLLSYSAMTMFLGCPKKYAFKYIDRVEPDDGDTSALDRGRAFHLLAETSGEAEANQIITEVGDDLFEAARVRTAYAKYRDLELSGALPRLEKKEVKIISEEHQYIGYVDGIGVEDSGNWQLGEIKTTRRFDPIKWGTLMINTQISLYTSFANEFAHENFLDMDAMRGVTYRTVVVSAKQPLKASKAAKPRKGARLADETPEEFEQRIKDDAKVFHQVVSPTDEAKRAALHSFGRVKEEIHRLGGRSGNAHKNAGNCFAYGRPCEFFKHCWGIDPLNDEQLQITDDNLEGVDE